jgi:CheY-like chemotaxis protein
MPKRILFAEDNPEDRIPVAKYLRNKDWDVTEVFDPEQAIEILKENKDKPFDVVILDLVMPENNPKGGEQVLRFIRSQDKHQRRQTPTPVILATAWGYNGPAQRAKAVYPEAVKSILTKTFALKDLSDALIAACAAPKT